MKVKSVSQRLEVRHVHAGKSLQNTGVISVHAKVGLVVAVRPHNHECFF